MQAMLFLTTNVNPYNHELTLLGLHSRFRAQPFTYYAPKIVKFTGQIIYSPTNCKHNKHPSRSSHVPFTSPLDICPDAVSQTIQTSPSLITTASKKPVPARHAPDIH
jgi:hypothetical protein